MHLLQPQPLTDPLQLTETYKNASSRILLFDYDGTLTPIVPDPASAILSPLTSQHLSRLASNLKNTVWIISGRDRAFLTQHLGSLSPRLGLCAEHGAFIREPGSVEWVSLAGTEDMGWRGVVRDLFQDLTHEVQGSHVEAKEAAMVWHFRRAVDVAYAEGRAAAVVQQLREGCVGRKWDVEIVEGKCVVEVRAKKLGKGGIVKRVLAERRVTGCPPFVGCWGDDRTDEGECGSCLCIAERGAAMLIAGSDMFQALRDSDLPDEVVFSVKVGDNNTPTCAKWIVAEPEEVLSCIRYLTELKD